MASRNRLLDRFPLLGEKLGEWFSPPRDADWLPRHWEPGVYPKGKRGSDNTEAILQWFDYYLCLYQECLIPSVDAPGEYEDPGEVDRGGPVRNAYRLVDRLQERSKGRLPPLPEPSRGYAHYRADLEAVVDELKKVRKWVTEAAAVEAETAGLAAGGPPAGESPRRGEGSPRPKRSTIKGEAEAKLIAALTKHHKYADGGCLDLEPIGCRALARLAGLPSASSASRFFDQHFQGHAKYQACCALGPTELGLALKILNGELRPRDVPFGRTPPGEGGSEEE